MSERQRRARDLGIVEPSLEQRWAEVRLRALHDAIPDAFDVPDFSSSYMRFLRSLRERLHPIGHQDLRTVEGRSGLKWRVDLGDRLGCDFYYGYCAEAYEAELFLAVLRPGACVVDVGASFGYYALSAAVVLGPQGSVHAFEPDPQAFSLLLEGVRLNGVTNVRCHELCLAAENGEADFYAMEESAFSGLSQTGRARLREKIRVPVRSLDSIFPEFSVPEIGGMKIDVEGQEPSVLRGGRETIRRSTDLFVMLEVSEKNRDAHGRVELEAALQELWEEGFRGWTADAAPQGLRAIAEPHEIGALGSGNVFLARSGSETERRLLSAARELRGRAFRGIAAQLGVDPEVLLSRNAVDPHHGLSLHAALVASIVRGHEARIRALRADKKSLAGSLASLQAEMSALRRRLDLTEQDSQARLALVKKHADTVDALNKNKDELDAEKQRLTAELERNAGLVRALETELHTLRETLDRDRAHFKEKADQRNQRSAELDEAKRRLAAELEQQVGKTSTLKAELRTLREAVERERSRFKEQADQWNQRSGELDEAKRRLAAELEEQAGKTSTLGAELRTLREAFERDRAHLEEQTEYWKKEAQLGVRAKLWRWIRQNAGRE